MQNVIITLSEILHLRSVCNNARIGRRLSCCLMTICPSIDARKRAHLFRER